MMLSTNTYEHTIVYIYVVINNNKLTEKINNTDCIYFFSAENVMPKTMSPDLLKALQGVCYIAQHIKDADKDKEVNYYY